MPRKKMYGFIEDWTEMILQHVPVNETWARANARAALSTAVSKIAVRSPLGNLSLNTFDLMIGPSGMYKSVVMWNFLFPVLQVLKEKVGVDLVMPSRFSIEGLIEWFAKHSSTGVFIRDEFTSVFKETSKSYLAEILEFISEMYDGRMQKRFTRKTKLETVQNVYIPILGATTPYIYKIMRPSFFVQGTGNRPRYIVFKGKERAEDFHYDFSDLMEFRRNERNKDFAETLKMFFNSSIEKLYLMPEAEEAWVKFRQRVDKEIEDRYKKNPFDLKYSYLARSPERVLKYAGLNRLSMMYKAKTAFKTQQVLAITKEDIGLALQEERESINHFEEMFRQWQKWGREEEPVTTHKDKLWQMCVALENAPNHCLNTDQWYRNQDVVAAENTFFSYKKKISGRGWIKALTRGELEKVKLSPEEIDRLELTSGPNVKVWTVTEKWRNLS